MARRRRQPYRDRHRAGDVSTTRVAEGPARPGPTTLCLTTSRRVGWTQQFAAVNEVENDA
jgi:hypothetical protein